MRVWQQEGRYAEELLFASGFQRRLPIWEDIEKIHWKSRSVFHGRSRKVSRILPSRTSMVVTMKRKSLRMTAATRTTAILRIMERMELRATTRKKTMVRVRVMMGMTTWMRAWAMMEMKHTRCPARLGTKVCVTKQSSHRMNSAKHQGNLHHHVLFLYMLHITQQQATLHSSRKNLPRI